ncbi:HNH endonuclease signature motif containing protein [Cytophagaceae bacterium YF14B1]|uniref:HNH endonuclease signature motif containing protein n=1 Tax=Xanthocytophaga flava TaxID=3048013 RepID=A0AAE3QNZ5_9BACT|nr:HNH endonuclease signature motif containing protein [Xanthocytophaga flavus]MDJ1482847.1 HNH endonuclease signature motif containing protein [Xanthocytophaga flavus]
MSKKEIRQQFRNSVFKRDNFTCQVCQTQQSEDLLDAHHITDRNEMPNGGYVAENGITVCKGSCHMKVEQFHISEGKEWEPDLHPNDLYRLIGSSKELAVQKSETL